jgi:thiol-disulfide isomerase/thioredoxin
MARLAILVLTVSLPLAGASAQSLGDVARKEKKRREANERDGVKAREISESDVRTVPPPAPGGTLAPEAELLGGDIPATPGETLAPLAPEFTLPDRDGRSVSLRELRGRPILVDFWATWCAPCRATMPEVERLHQEFGRELTVVGINIEGKSPEVLAYLAEGRYTFRVLFDGGNWESVVARSYGVTSIPRTFLIDRAGRIVFAGHPASLSEAQIRAAIAR